MGCVKALLVILAVLVPMCGILINEILKQKVPPGFSKPKDLQVNLGWESVKKTVANILIEMGLINKLKYLRTTKVTDRFLPKENLNVQVKEKRVAGIRVRIYTPRVLFKTGPVVFYIHGGGWVYGSISRSELLMHNMAPKLGAIMVSIGYKRSPKFKFPKPVEDCAKVVKYFMENPNEFDVDKKLFALLGDGAGGNIATAVALKLGQEPELPKLKTLVLVQPAIQALNFNTASYWENQDFPLLTKRDMVEFWLYYAFGHTRYASSLLTNDHVSPGAKKTYKQIFNHKVLPASLVHKDYTPNKMDFGNETMWEEIRPIFENELFMPIVSKNLKVLPSTYIYTTGLDVLRDDGILFYFQLRQANVDVSHFQHKPGFHGILDYLELYHEAVEASDQIVKHLKSKILHDRIVKQIHNHMHHKDNKI